MPFFSLQTVIDWVATRFHVSAEAVHLLKAANTFSGLNARTLPTELVPLNSLQLARGVLNFTVLQSLNGWVLPYWARMQYDPRSPSFIPRSHLGVSMNLTHRNWTGVGVPESAVEAVVDPRGMVTMMPNGWSLDIWCVIEGRAYYAPLQDAVSQRLIDDCPIVETRWILPGGEMIVTTFMVGSRVTVSARLTNHSPHEFPASLVAAVRPFNPEGISLINTIHATTDGRRLVINNRHTLEFSQKPDRLVCSDFEHGDAAAGIVDHDQPLWTERSSCRYGLAAACALFDTTLAPGVTTSLDVTCDVEHRTPACSPAPTLDAARRTWKERMREAACLQIPDEHLSALFRASASSLLMLLDGATITPGPFTYHQHWFRDSAYMITALDKLGLHANTKPILASFPSWQTRAGFFRSQQGEWDSNGQALWTLWQHTMISGDDELARRLMPSCRRAAQWIRKTRIRPGANADARVVGLLPAGLSAEHLGLSDYYFWDDFWSIAGLEAFARLCGRLDHHGDGREARALAGEFRATVDRSIAATQAARQTQAVPAGPLRGIDVGMIGSCCACYPLQLYPPGDPSMAATVSTLLSEFTEQGMFFQHFIHSGMNPYLTLQLAHSLLYLGKRNEFWTLLQTVAARATSTMTFPEAIHPATGGGVMGDGHHGWAAAEIVLAVRDAFVYESWHTDGNGHDVVLLAGIPADWFTTDETFCLAGAAVPGGRIDIAVTTRGTTITINLHWEGSSDEGPDHWRILVPCRAALHAAPAESICEFLPEEARTEVRVIPGTQTIGLRRIPD